MATSLVWVVTGMILLGAMAFGGINLWLKKRREAKNPELYGSRIRPDDFEEDEK